MAHVDNINAALAATLVQRLIGELVHRGVLEPADAEKLMLSAAEDLAKAPNPEYRAAALLAQDIASQYEAPSKAGQP